MKQLGGERGEGRGGKKARGESGFYGAGSSRLGLGKKKRGEGERGRGKRRERGAGPAINILGDKRGRKRGKEKEGCRFWCFFPWGVGLRLHPERKKEEAICYFFWPFRGENRKIGVRLNKGKKKRNPILLPYSQEWPPQDRRGRKKKSGRQPMGGRRKKGKATHQQRHTISPHTLASQHREMKGVKRRKKEREHDQARMPLSPMVVRPPTHTGKRKEKTARDSRFTRERKKEKKGGAVVEMPFPAHQSSTLQGKLGERGKGQKEETWGGKMRGRKKE